MSNVTELTIEGGADFIFEIKVSYDDNVTFKTMTNPLMEIREAASIATAKLARFDTTGTQEGLITSLTSPARLKFSMEQDKTAALALLATKGYFDIFADIDGVRIRVASGVVRIPTHITALT